MSTTTFPSAPPENPPLPPQGSAARVAAIKPRPTARYQSGVWIGIFAITMSFAAFTSALFVRQGSGDWIHVVLPRLLYVNTGVLLLSSLTLEMARRAFLNVPELDASALRHSLALACSYAGIRIRFRGGTIFRLAGTRRTGTLPGDEFQ